MARPFTAVLVDLDGTIVDSAPGIVGSLAHTYAELGLPIPTPAELLKWVGPPILESFRDLAGFDEKESWHALEIYRAHYRAVGVLDAPAYPGVIEALRTISESGLPMSLATSKPESLANLILDHLGISDAFTEITGASEDEKRSHKADVVAEALRRLRIGGADLSRTVMVGDRIHDVEGAGAHGVPTVFVEWGYGAPSEAAGAIATVDTAVELLAELGL